MPHPSKVVPKIVLIVVAILVFIGLFRNLEKEAPPHPVRIGTLAHAERGLLPDQLLAVALPSPLEMARVPSGRSPILWPMGGEEGALVYNAQPFLENKHLGADLNGIGGQNSDLGDPVYAIQNAYVTYSGWAGPGWGNVVILEHRGEKAGVRFQTLSAHLDRSLVGVGQVVSRGDRIGTVGTADGKYLAHLHLEWRQSPRVSPGRGYAPFPLGRLAPESLLPVGELEARDLLRVDAMVRREAEPRAPIVRDTRKLEQTTLSEEEKEGAREPRQ